MIGQHIRRWVAVGLLVPLVAACAGTSADESSTTAPTTSSAPETTTTTIATTTTTTVPSPTTWDVDPTALAAAVEVLESFSYAYEVVSWEAPGEENGFRATGDFVGPEATSCRLSQASFMGFTPTYEVTYIDNSAWREDVLLSTYETTRESISDFLEACPGAPEFWARAPFEAPSLSYVNPHEGEVDGAPTLRFDIESQAEQLSITSGTLDVSEEGVPVALTLVGSASGAEFRVLLALESDIDVELLEFEIHYELTDLGSQSLMVRSPDGSLTRGPLGEIVAQIPQFPLSADLQALVDSAHTSQCALSSHTQAILANLGEEPEFDSMSVVQEEGSLTNHTVGTFVKASLDEAFSTSSTGNVAASQVLLHFNHYRGYAAFFWFLGQGQEFRAKHEDGESVWNTETIAWADGSEQDANIYAFLRYPDGESVVPDDLRSEVDSAIEEWMLTFESVLVDLATLHPQALADLEALGAELDQIEALLCVELNRAYEEADAAFNTHGTEWVIDNPGVLAREIAAQEALVVLEYLRAIDGRLSSGAVEYLEGPEATFDESNYDNMTSDVEYTKVLAHAGRDSLESYQQLMALE